MIEIQGSITLMSLMIWMYICIYIYMLSLHEVGQREAPRSMPVA